MSYVSQKICGGGRGPGGAGMVAVAATLLADGGLALDMGLVLIMDLGLVLALALVILLWALVVLGI